MRACFLFPLIFLAQPIFGWGDVGHRTVGYLAQKFFTAEASQWVDDLLENDKGYDIGDGATFADAVRRKRPWTKTWHYIGIFSLAVLVFYAAFSREMIAGIADEKSRCIRPPLQEPVQSRL